MRKENRTLARFADMNVSGRLLFLAVPAFAASAAHVIVLAIGGQAEIGALFGCLAAAIASVAAAWRWLDEPAAVAFEPVNARGALLAGALSIPAFAILPQLAFACVACSLASFGAMAGLSRITAFSDEPDQPSGSGTLAWLAWAAQASVVASILSTSSVAAAIAVSAALGVASTALCVIGERQPLPAVGASD